VSPPYALASASWPSFSTSGPELDVYPVHRRRARCRTSPRAGSGPSRRAEHLGTRSEVLRRRVELLPRCVSVLTPSSSPPTNAALDLEDHVAAAHSSSSSAAVRRFSSSGRRGAVEHCGSDNGSSPLARRLDRLGQKRAEETVRAVGRAVVRCARRSETGTRSAARVRTRPGLRTERHVRDDAARGETRPLRLRSERSHRSPPRQKPRMAAFRVSEEETLTAG